MRDLDRRVHLLLDERRFLAAVPDPRSVDPATAELDRLIRADGAGA